MLYSVLLFTGSGIVAFAQQFPGGLPPCAAPGASRDPRTDMESGAATARTDKQNVSQQGIGADVRRQVHDAPLPAPSSLGEASHHPPYPAGHASDGGTASGQTDSLNMLAGLLRALIERGHVCTGGVLLSHVLYDGCALSICSHPDIPVWCALVHGLVCPHPCSRGGEGGGTVSPFLTTGLGDILAESILHAFVDEYADALQGAASAGGHGTAQYSAFQYRLAEIVREALRRALGRLVEAAGALAGQLLLADGGHESVVSTSSAFRPSSTTHVGPGVGGARPRSSTAGTRASAAGGQWWNRPRHGSDMGSTAAGTVSSTVGWGERERLHGSWGRASARPHLPAAGAGSGLPYRAGQAGGASVVEDGLYGAGDMRLLASIPTALSCASASLAMVPGGDVPVALWYAPASANRVQAPAALLLPLQGTGGCVLALHGHSSAHGGVSALYDCLCGARSQPGTGPAEQGAGSDVPLQALEALSLTQALCAVLAVLAGHGAMGTSGVGLGGMDTRAREGFSFRGS